MVALYFDRIPHGSQYKYIMGCCCCCCKAYGFSAYN